MVTTTMRALWIGAGLVLGAPASGAQEAVEAVRLVWSGGEDATELSVDDVERAIRALEAEVAVTRDFADVDARLAELWKRATYGQHAERIDAILITMEARSEFLHDTNLDRAIDVASRLWIDEADLERYGWSRADFRPATAAEREAESRSLEDGKLGVYFRTFREEQRAAVSGGDAGPASEPSLDPLVRRVRRLLPITGGGNRIRELGPVAVEPLKQLAVESIDEFLMADDADPLTYLFELVDVEALELCRAHVDDGGYFWRRRILRALENRLPSEAGRAAWSEILETCLADPDLVPEVVDLLERPSVMSRGLVTQAMIDGLLAAVADGTPDLLQHVAAFLERFDGVQDLEPLVDGLLVSPHREVAEVGARAATWLDDLDPLRTLVDHPSPVVRRALAEALRPSGEVLRRRGEQFAKVQRRPRLQPGDAARLARLAVDPDESVRLEAAKTIVASPLADEVGRDALLALARDASVDVRVALATLELADVELLRDVLVTLAEPVALDVESMLIGRLGARDWGARTPAYVATLKAVYAARDDWRARDPHEELRAFHTALRVALENALAEVVGWVAAERDDWLTANTVVWIEDEPQLFALHTARPEDLAYVLAQGPRLAAPAARWVGRTEEWLSRLETFEYLFRELKDSDVRWRRGHVNHHPLPVEALVRLTTADVPPAVHLGALGALCEHWRPELTPRFLQALRSPEERGRNEPSRLTRWAFEAAQSNEVALAIVLDRDVPDPIAHELVVGFLREGQRTVELARAVLDRWLEREWRYAAVGEAIAIFGHHPEVDDEGLLEREALGSRYAEAAIAALDRRRDPASFPTLARCLRAEWIVDPEHRMNVRLAAARALTNSLRDEAARILLSELETTDDDELRAALLKGLQTIRTYQDEQATWRRRLAEKELRADAIRELLAILDDEADPAIRAEAARALGTLGAIEALPRLIRLLRDEDVELRTAARDALDRLQRASEPSPARESKSEEGESER